jgi:hypothetical protein
MSSRLSGRLWERQIMARAFTYDSSFAGSESRSRLAAFERLDRLSRLLDTAIAVPGTNIRFGMDGIIGLVPGIGDTVTTLLAAYIVHQAWRIGVPRTLLVRMIANVAFDGLMGAVPIAGDVFDVLWRGNRRNVRLLREHLAREGVVSGRMERE